jgi:hypothetical protein
MAGSKRVLAPALACCATRTNGCTIRTLLHSFTEHWRQSRASFFQQNGHSINSSVSTPRPQDATAASQSSRGDPHFTCSCEVHASLRGVHECSLSGCRLLGTGTTHVDIALLFSFTFTCEILHSLPSFPLALHVIRTRLRQLGPNNRPPIPPLTLPLLLPEPHLLSKHTRGHHGTRHLGRLPARFTTEGIEGIKLIDIFRLAE